MMKINIPIYGEHKKKINDGEYLLNEFKELYLKGNPNHHFTFFNYNTTNFIKIAKQYYKEKHIVYKKEYDERYYEYLYYELNKCYDVLFGDTNMKGDIQYANNKQTQKETTQISTI